MCECRTRARSPTLAASPPASRMTDGEEVERALQPRLAQLEIALGDRRHEALVERLRDPQHAMDAVPAESDRDLVDAQLACVEDAQDLDSREPGGEQRPVLLER